MTDTLIDIEQPGVLVNYLRETGHIDVGDAPQVTTLAGGVSNRTVLLELENGDSYVVKQALKKLRVQVDWFCSPERIHREAEGLRWLARLAPPGTLPDFVFEDHIHHLLGMRAVPQPHINWKTSLLRGDLSLEHATQFGHLLGTIHRQSQAHTDEIAIAFADRSFFEDLRLEPYYAYTATQVSDAAAFLNALIDETRATRLTIVHGDYSPKNILVHEGRLILLDHEVIHFGDPAFDLGFAQTHLLSKAHHIAHIRSNFIKAAHHFWRAYRAAIDDPAWIAALEARAARHTLACLLARVDGRSPLEYLSDDERHRQRAVVLELMRNPPNTLPTLFDQFATRLFDS
ncbi:MAG: aminoglycoside phosphotransferase family protein [Chloroflexi bacterium]|nr:MAG: aminoglycoside phosphotransferase family protein [Chloroflexota bacterium]